MPAQCSQVFKFVIRDRPMQATFSLAEVVFGKQVIRIRIEDLLSGHTSLFSTYKIGDLEDRVRKMAIAFAEYAL